MSDSDNLPDRVQAILQECGPMSATDMTAELDDRGWLPEMWTVIDVADFLREWFA